MPSMENLEAVSPHLDVDRPPGATSPDRGAPPRRPIPQLTRMVRECGWNDLGVQPPKTLLKTFFRSNALGNVSGRTGVVFLVFSAQNTVMDASDLIRTGEAAQLLGCSRQHVVDLCNEGQLPFVREGGSHRRMRRSDVLALAKRALTRDQEQSRWLHGAIAGHLVTDPELVLWRARENLDRFSAIHDGTMAKYWLDRWRVALDAGPEQVLGVLTSDSPLAAELRQNSPFAGILPQDERLAVLESFRRHWQAEHAS